MNTSKLSIFMAFAMNLVPSWYHWDRWGLNCIHGLRKVGVDVIGSGADKNPVYFQAVLFL